MINSRSKCFYYQKQQGFVLVMTLALIAIGLLAVEFISGWIDQEVENYTNHSTSLQQTIDEYSTLSTVIYVASTRPATYAGIAFPPLEKHGFTLPTDETGDPIVAMQGNELRLDNRLYKGIGQSLFRIQDEAGLISVNTLTKDRLKILFALIDINQQTIPSALAKLKDYIDQDSEYRPNGAELRQYRDRKIKGPANHPLRTPKELASILGWTTIMSNQQFNKIAPFLTATPVVPININTSSKETLLIAGITPSDADKIIIFRENQAINFINIRTLLTAAQDMDYTDKFQYYTSRSLRVSILSTKQDKIEVYYLQMTPHIVGGKPWHFRYKETQYSAHLENLDQAIATGKPIFSEY